MPNVPRPVSNAQIESLDQQSASSPSPCGQPDRPTDGNGVDNQHQQSVEVPSATIPAPTTHVQTSAGEDVSNTETQFVSFARRIIVVNGEEARNTTAHRNAHDTRAPTTPCRKRSAPKAAYSSGPAQGTRSNMKRQKWSMSDTMNVGEGYLTPR